MSWLLDGMRHMSQEVEAHIAWVDACNHGMMLSKSWAFLSNSPEIQHIGCLCPHAERHESIAGKRNEDGVFISTLTAEYPLSLAQHIIRHMSYISGHQIRLGRDRSTQVRRELEPTVSGASSPPMRWSWPLENSGSHESQAVYSAPCSCGSLAGVGSPDRHARPGGGSHQPGQARAAAHAWEADQPALIAFKALETAPPHSLLPEEGQNFRLLLVEAFAQASVTSTRPSSNC